MHACIYITEYMYICYHSINAESKPSSLAKVYHMLLKQNNHTWLEITVIV